MVIKQHKREVKLSLFLFLEFYLDVERLNFLQKILAIYSDCDIIKLKKGKKFPKKERRIKNENQ